MIRQRASPRHRTGATPYHLDKHDTKSGITSTPYGHKLSTPTLIETIGNSKRGGALANFYHYRSRSMWIRHTKRRFNRTILETIIRHGRPHPTFSRDLTHSLFSQPRRQIRKSISLQGGALVKFVLEFGEKTQDYLNDLERSPGQTASPLTRVW